MPKYPDRWLNYSKFGEQVEGTPFVALRVPLSKIFFENRQHESFTPKDALEQIPNLGLVIDLTFTAKYYNPKEFQRNGVDYTKIYTKGHVVPNTKLVNQFIRIVDKFRASEQNKDKVIGVHCTHGLNRTGYFICAYMILVQGQDPKLAIKLFNKARGHEMERPNYLSSLESLIHFSKITDGETDLNPRTNNRPNSNDNDWSTIQKKERRKRSSGDNRYNKVRQTSDNRYTNARSTGDNRYNNAGDSRYNKPGSSGSNKQTYEQQNRHPYKPRSNDYDRSLGNSGNNWQRKYTPYFQRVHENRYEHLSTIDDSADNSHTHRF